LTIAGNDTWPPATEGPEGLPPRCEWGPMEKPDLHEQTEPCRRLARDPIDRALRDSLLKLADEYAERTGAKDNMAVAPASSNDQSGA
jgi:hypothetical protein